MIRSESVSKSWQPNCAFCGLEWHNRFNLRHPGIEQKNTLIFGSSRDGSVGIATGWTAEGSELQSRKGQESSPLHVALTCSGAHPASYPMGTWDSPPGVKRLGRDANHSPPTSDEVKKTWIYTSTPPYAFMAYCLIN
jgi:hypothetical protein